jgi:hypothetical protein
MRGFSFLCCAADTIKTLALFETMLAGLPVDFGAAESRTGTLVYRSNSRACRR